MDCASLKERLEEAGCSESYYSIRCRNDNTFALDQFDGEWWVFYTERGSVSDPEFRLESEEAACEYLWEKMQGIRQDHLVGWFTDLTEAQEFSRALTQLGLENHIDHIPKPVFPQTVYRVFVYGKAIFEVRREFPLLPLTHWSKSS
jgi:hypothetical protein